MNKLYLLCLVWGSTLIAGDIVGWRSDGSGHYPGSEPALEWGSDKNILWKTKMPDWSNAQAVLVGDRIFCNAEPSTLICLDAASGQILWQHTNTYEDVLSEKELAALKEKAGTKADPLRAEREAVSARIDELWKQFDETKDESIRGKIRGQRLKIRELDRKINEVDPLNIPNKHADNGFTSAVPLSDGKAVYAIYGNGVVCAYSLDGKRLWAKVLEKPEHGWGHSASPALSGDTLLVHIRDLVALDNKTGKERWRAEAKESWGSPIATEIGGEPVVITAAEGKVFRTSDGKQVGEAGGLEYATPFIKEGILYLIENKARAVKVPEQFSESISFDRVWQSRIKGSRHYASSLVVDDLIYGVSREGWLSVMDKASGELIYEKELGINGDNRNSVYPSLSYAGGHVFIGFEEGVTLVLSPGREYKEVARNELERFRGTPIFHGDRIYLRGLEHMYCIATK